MWAALLFTLLVGWVILGSLAEIAQTLFWIVVIVLLLAVLATGWNWLKGEK